jgi:hypothetical protein
VEREVGWWLEHRPVDRLLIVLTGGELAWDDAARDYDWKHGAAVALYTAEGLLHPKQGCKFAETKRDQGPGRFWVEPASTSPAR